MTYSYGYWTTILVFEILKIALWNNNTSVTNFKLKSEATVHMTKVRLLYIWQLNKINITEDN